MVKKNKQKLLIGLVLLSILVITVGITYAFFSYTKQGTKDNVIQTGTITFLYTEVDKVGAGIEIEDAIPMSDSLGKVQTGSGKVFNFKINADTTNTTAINYEITAKKSDDSTLDDSVVKLYLTKVVDTTEEELLLNTFDKLDLPSKEGLDTTKEKLIYKGKVPRNNPGYEQNFRLRMWIDEETDFSGVEQEDGTLVYPYNDKSFKINVNVYADGNVITEEDIENESNSNITTISLNDTILTAVENQAYDYSVDLLYGTNQAIINIETENENATVEIEKLDSLAYSSNIKRLSTKKTVELNPGENYYKITVTSENKQVKAEYIIRINVITESVNTLNSLSLTGCTLSPVFDSDTTNYSCTVSSSTTATTVSYEKTWDLSTVEIIGDTNNLVAGDNIITIKVTAENGEEKTYTVVIKREFVSMTSTTVLSVGDSVVAKDGSKWHVLEASGSDSDTVVLLSDYNLNTDGTYNTSCGKNINGKANCSTMVFSSSTNVYDETNSNNIGYFIKNTYEPLVLASLPGTTNVTIPTAYQIADIYNITISQTIFTLTDGWATTTNYWTKTARTSAGYIWLVDGANRYLRGLGTSTTRVGTRPVITTPKTNLLAQ